MFFNIDCIDGAKLHLPDNSVDLIVTDPPYGIDGASLHKHYNRKEETVLDGYIDVDTKDYAQFSIDWIQQAARVLRPGGTIYIVSGYTHLFEILQALRTTELREVNHIIWKFNFGVYTKKKFVSSHYHILYYVKQGGEPTFNTFCRFGDSEKAGNSGSLNYLDREDVWQINKEYKPGEVKNKNQLPTDLLLKMIQYSSKEGDLVCDFFLGSFSTAKVAIGLGRRASGFEKSKVAFDYQIQQMKTVENGWLLDKVRQPEANVFTNQGKPISQAEVERIISTHSAHVRAGKTQKDSIEILSKESGRGVWSIKRILDKSTEPVQFASPKNKGQMALFS